jgi:hypothetical protein
MFFAIENVGGRVHHAPGLAVGCGLACPEKPDRTPRAKRFRAPLNFVSVRKKIRRLFCSTYGNFN